MNVFRLVTVGLIASFLSLFGGNYAAAEGPPGLARFTAAVKRFEELQMAAQARNTEPRLGDPEVSDLLFVLSDVDSLFGSAKYNKDDLVIALATCSSVGQIIDAYKTHGLADVADANITSSKTEAWKMRNFSIFQDEVAPLLGFQLKCMAKTVPMFKDLVSSLRPEDWNYVRRKSLKDLRESMAGEFINWLAVFGNGSLRPENEALMLSSLAGTASPLADLMTLAQRKSILERAKKVSVGEDLKPYLDRIIAAMGWTYCGELCRRSNEPRLE